MILLMMNTMFTGGLKEEICNKVLEQGPTRIQESVNLTREIEIIHKDKREKLEKGHYVAAIGSEEAAVTTEENKVLEIESEEVNSVRQINIILQRMNKPPLRYKVRPGSRPLMSMKTATCRFCKLKGQMQCEFRKRMAAGAPMVDATG